MAALTIPIIGFLAILLNMPCIGIMCLITHKGSILHALTMVNVSYKAWLKFIMPLVLMLLVVNAVFLVVGIYL
jgi:uncharacterized ion transporter superfamily protein YfcC